MDAIGSEMVVVSSALVTMWAEPAIPIAIVKATAKTLRSLPHQNVALVEGTKTTRTTPVTDQRSCGQGATVIMRAEVAQMNVIAEIV